MSLRFPWLGTLMLFVVACGSAQEAAKAPRLVLLYAPCTVDRSMEHLLSTGLQKQASQVLAHPPPDRGVRTILSNASAFRQAFATAGFAPAEQAALLGMHSFGRVRPWARGRRVQISASCKVVWSYPAQRTSSGLH